MDKKTSFVWSLGVGLLFVVLSFIMFLSGYGSLESGTLTVYGMIFLSGTLIGVVLVYFLRRSEKQSVSKVTMVAFVLSLPFAMFGVMFGSIVGGTGIFLLGVSPAVFVIGVSFYLGRAFAGK